MERDSLTSDLPAEGKGSLCTAEDASQAGSPGTGLRDSGRAQTELGEWKNCYYSPCHAEQGLAADAFQRPLRSRFQALLKAGVRRLSLSPQVLIEKPEKGGAP